MQSDLIIKENELLDPNNYPEEQRKLVNDFNSRIMRITGIVTGLSQEYHTIWLINIKDKTMSLYRSTGMNTARGAVEIGLKYNNYDKFLEEYVENYVIDSTEHVFKDMSTDVVLGRIKDGELYTVDYMRMDDVGTLAYHQVAYALAGEPDTAQHFILAFRDIDHTVRRHISDKRYLREQLDIVAALSRDYYNIFKIDYNTASVVILKLDGYVTKGMDKPGEKQYSYDVLYKQYVKDRVYPEDQPALYDAMSFDSIVENLKTKDEYVSSYRVLDNGEVHYYQYTYIPVNPQNIESGILAAFKNVDSIVESAKEREALAVLAETDIMTGILNRGSGELRVIDALANGKTGMLCIMDIDNFKTINDHFGHTVGDKVIRGIADIINSEFRENDIVFRLGGDEYAVYAQGVATKKAGKAILERVFDKVSELDISELNGYKVSVSVGATIQNKKKTPKFEAIYKEADSCVYVSKGIPGCAITFH